MTDDTHVIQSGRLTAIIKAHGAELCSLRDEDGVEFIWQAGPAWPRHAPLLFPIVGRLASDVLRHRGKTYRMTQHGFARDQRFAWAEREASRCVLVLNDSEATRALYPFAFRLVATYVLDAAGLEVALSIVNTGGEMLPASLGGHPAFNWPLQPTLSKESYALTFADEEPFPIRRLDGGLLRAAPAQSPVQGKVLGLSEALFADDAIIFAPINSASVRYAARRGAARGPWLEMSWSGFRELGVWSKPSGAPFLCIEPWRGYASPSGFDGEFSDKPGLMRIAPRAEEVLSFRIQVGMS
ncbi:MULTISPECIES: aldose 1-epimerase family protein [unclassified Bradyrhizobium]|uniref:aldose 1-epimerase family protein n=1 Tax=unclassified Bradyrhizobium TaxID=2631580 RepID=UPI00247929F5|nr:MULTISPECIES: aldose 1-epimerase family protein [unclassified Bradyrhizobium]WGR73533.1 aldose 1-epimerase family protein [Bradyrhizobium sp. ISRA426]WGR78370.1 aldose 1-epimerase family protein [Bradyrhizobium sp. ISRA430]WGR88772.1 aldose 1-epimerase family protein [Bradyrhizobium sp. ISRA432]